MSTPVTGVRENESDDYYVERLIKVIKIREKDGDG